MTNASPKQTPSHSPTRAATAGLRSRAGLVVEAGDCWDVHHLAVLVGYGAGAVCPWLSLATARAEGDHSVPEELRNYPARSRRGKALRLQ